MPGLLTQLKGLVQEIDDCAQPSSMGCPKPCCAPCCETPFAQVCFTCPPEGPLPTCPCPVKALQMPCLPGRGPTPEQLAAKERANVPNSRYDNFYNNYNVDYRQQALVEPKGEGAPAPRQRRAGLASCDDYTRRDAAATSHYNSGCPTGFKPCQMRLAPPPCCNPIGVWRASVLPCPPGAKKKDGGGSTLLPPPECCTRPGCRHWKPEGGPCLYDAPCRAHCFNHPPGMKPSGKAACTLPPEMCGGQAAC